LGKKIQKISKPAKMYKVFDVTMKFGKFEIYHQKFIL
jgi:hypothetical protein